MLENIEKGKLLIEGKTKKIWSRNDSSAIVIVENKDTITKNDDPSQTKELPGKGCWCTGITCAIFQALKDAGIPVAFEKQLGPTTFLSPAVHMIPLEVIWRRYAVGSFLKRNPHFETSDGSLPHRFHSAVFELFLKTDSGGIIRDKDGKECGKSPKSDPFIVNPYDNSWILSHPKKPRWDQDADLGIGISRDAILPSNVEVREIENLLRRVGLVLEGLWFQLGCRLIDLKIEMGVLPSGGLVVADVIDADSWRLRDSEWQELSKQLFRDNVPMKVISNKYTMVANLVERFRIPKQAIVVWRGSKNDCLGIENPKVQGVDLVDIVLSGHKSPEKCIEELEKTLSQYPDGGVILSCIGMSNGLGPMLAARTVWPVISVPLSVEEFPNDVWSSLRMPSEVPMPTILKLKNAMLAALNILSQKNPIAYAQRQLAIESLDK